MQERGKKVHFGKRMASDFQEFGKPMASGSLLRIMISTKLYLDCRKSKPGSPAPLKFVINKNKVRALIPLDIKIPSDFWNSEDEKALKKYAYLNDLIEQKYSYLRSLLFQMEMRGEVEGLKACEIKRKIQDKISGPEPEKQPETELVAPDNFKARFESFKASRPAEGTRNLYSRTWTALEKYAADKKIPLSTLSFSDIDLKWLQKFDEFLKPTSPSRNARNIHFRNIRAVFNDALNDEVITCYPFRKFKLKNEETRKRSLVAEDLKRLFDFKVEKYAEFYLDIFKLTFFLIGINPVDLSRLPSKIKDGRIDYRRAKTHKLYSIKVEPEAMEIIDKYRGEKFLLSIFDRWKDYKQFAKQTNKALQLIGAPRTGLGGEKGEGMFPDLTLYWARHSWATIAADLDIPDAVISQALGHSAENRITEVYIRRNQKKVDDANRKVIDWVLYNKK